MQIQYFGSTRLRKRFRGWSWALQAFAWGSLWLLFPICGLSQERLPVEVKSPTAADLRVAIFRVDATPPIGSPVAYATARSVDDPLWVRGIVLMGAGEPIVLCAIDWIGLSNRGHDVWREHLARAAGTSVERVAIHALHQHDGVRCDFDIEEMLAARGFSGYYFDVGFVRQTIENTAAAIRRGMQSPQRVTHLGIGIAPVEKVASNRRILGPDGKVDLFRMSSWKISEDILPQMKVNADREGYRLSPFHPEEAQEAPEGVIDPLLRMISLWDGEQPVVCLSYYATHPQSYFGYGDLTSEFVGLARARREAALDDLPHIHFNGAGGNIAAGKYNDATPETRKVLTDRMADGMRRAWEATRKVPLDARQIDWRVAPVSLPPGEHLVAEKLQQTLDDASASTSSRASVAKKLAFLKRMQSGHQVELSCLRLKNVYLLHMPGELFVEYQLAAQQIRPDDVVCMAAYGEYGTGYIGTKIAYEQGGYETGPGASNVAPEVEDVLMEGVRKLLK